jgi:hypothetical protein
MTATLLKNRAGTAEAIRLDRNELRRELAAVRRAIRFAVTQWKKCSSRRLSWASGQHCVYCDPMRLLVEDRLDMLLEQLAREEG